MNSIEALKEQARSHEQQEEWAKALDLYKKAIAKLAAEEQPDIGLINRVADIQVRQGLISEAVVNYEKAIDLYLEAELPNNAIWVCKKIVRNMPQRHTVYLRMGQIRGKQGLVADARQNFLTYAERMQAAGDIDEGLRALTELADLIPEEPDIRLAIAAQMQSHGRTDDAVAQLQVGYRQATERQLATGPIETMLRQLGAEPNLSAGAAAGAATPSTDDDAGVELGEIVIGGEPSMAEETPAVEAGGFEIAVGPAAGQEEEGEVEAAGEPEEQPLPTFDFAADGEESAPLPMLGEDEEEDTSEPLPMLTDFGEEPAAAPELDASAFGESDKGERELSEYVSGPTELPEIEIGLSIEPLDSAPARDAAMEEARARPASRPLMPE